MRKGNRIYGIITVLLLSLGACSLIHDDMEELGYREDGSAYAYVSLTIHTGTAGNVTRANPTGGEDGNGNEKGQDYENRVNNLTLFFYPAASGNISGVNQADVEFTADSASNSPLEFFDPYKIADMTELKSLYAEITEKYAEIADKLAAPDENGVLPDGMYDATIAEELDNLLETAAGYIEVEDEGIVTQVEADALVLNLNRTFDKLLASKAPYVVDVQGNWTIRVAGTENRLTRKNSASDNAGVYYYSALWSIDNVVSDANKTGADIADYRWDWTISKHNLSVVDETSGDTKEVEFYTIGNEQGYVTVDGYLREVGEITSYNYANYALEFVKAETTDSLVAIRRMSDRLYWGNGFSWKAPYDKVNTASAPQYVFVLDEQTTTTGIDNNEVASSTAVKTEYYSISGMKVEAPVSGIFIKKVTFDDGHVETSKIYVR